MSSDNVTISIPNEPTLLQLFTSLSDAVPLKLSIPINPSALELLNVILEKAPSTLVEPFENIIKDGKLTAADMPNIVLLVSNLHNEKFKELYKSSVTSESIFELIKMLVHALIDSERVKVDNKEAILNILDISISLLKMKLDTGVPSVNLRSCC